MSMISLTQEDQAAILLADSAPIQSALASLVARRVPPWLPSGHPCSDGVPRGLAAFNAIQSSDVIEAIAVRGPLHAIDGWGYIGRALNALVGGNAHSARHLAYYAELRGALSILASSGIGIFDRRNVVIDATGSIHQLSQFPTHAMCWATICQWAQSSQSLECLVRPLQISGISLIDIQQEFFPGASPIATASYLMEEWGFDLKQGVVDRDERNLSSYQPNALAPISTSAADDRGFLEMFWRSLRPGNYELDCHLLRILLEVEMRNVGDVSLVGHKDRYDRIDTRVKSILSFDFLVRQKEEVDHEFIIKVAEKNLPAHPYSMLCRAALLLRLATGMAEGNFIAAGVQPATQFYDWWREFGVQHGLWSPSFHPSNAEELWGDVDLALEDAFSASVAHRHDWIEGLSSSAMRICEAERVALWGLFR